MRCVSRLAQGQSQREATAAAVTRRATHRTAVTLGDLPHQRQPQAHATRFLGMARQPEEGLEDAFAVGFGDPRPAVADGHLDTGTRFDTRTRTRTDTRAPHLELNLATTVAACVFQQVAQRAPDQALVRAQQHGIALHAGVDPRGLFGGQAEQVDLVVSVQCLRRIEPAGKQHLVDQHVELADVDVDLVPHRGPLRGRGVFQHRNRHLQPRQR